MHAPGMRVQPDAIREPFRIVFSFPEFCLFVNRKEETMKIILAFAPLAAIVLGAAPALAHPGHLARVAGHTHTIFELVAQSSLIALVLLGYVVFLKIRSRG